MNWRLVIGGSSGALALGLLSAPASAQTVTNGETAAEGNTKYAPAQAAPQQSDSPSGDIIVTAQRRAESVQKTPLAITALGGSTLATANITDITALGTRLSNVSIATNAGITRIAIRGIGSNATQPNLETPLAYHVDGVYVSRGEAQGDSFYDVDRIEVVRGPQGTLYGRNATGGAVNIITRDPTDVLSGYGELTIGNYSTIIAEGAISGPITNDLSFRGAGQAIKRDGWGKDGLGRDISDQNTRAIRGKLKYESGPFRAIASAEYFHENDAAGALHYIRPGDNPQRFNNLGVALGYPLATDTYRDTNSDFPTVTKKNDWAASLNAEVDVAPWATITSITGYRSTDFYTQRDFDNTLLNGSIFYNFAKSHQFSEELRVGGASGNFTYVVGLYYFNDHINFTGRRFQNTVSLTAFTDPAGTVNTNNFLRGLLQRGILNTDAYAAFGQVSYEFTDWLGLDVGGRYSYEKKKKPYEVAIADYTNVAPEPVLGPFAPVNLPNFTPIPPTSATFKKFTPKITLRIEPTDDINFYATYAEGFRSGGYALGSGGAPFASETVTDYEGGVKTNWMDGRLQVNLAGFYYKYDNLQVFRLNPAGGILVESAGKADLYGAELSINARPVDSLRLNADMGLLHTEYKVFSSVNSQLPALGVQNLAGNRLVQAPDYTINAGAEYVFHPEIGDVTLRGEGQFIGKQYFTPFNTDTYSQPAFAMFNAFLTYASPKSGLTASIYVKNLTNKIATAILTQQPVNTGGFAAGEIYPPRTFGMKVGYHF